MATDASNPTDGARRDLYTIGHSNHSSEHLVALLTQHQIGVVADVRSVPRSGYSPQHDRAPLERELAAAGVRYVFLGDELGGRPPEGAFYDAEGHVRYDLVAKSPRFETGVRRLTRGVENYRVAVMCSEENPEHCHRRLLVGRVLTERGFTLHHIRGDGSLETEEHVDLRADSQPSLFDESEGARWRSTQSVSPSARPRTSSALSDAPGSAG